MKPERLDSLLHDLQEKNFWGTVEIGFKGGRVTHAKLVQTIQHTVASEESAVVVIVQQPNQTF